MEVILIQDVDNLGGTNEVVKVRNGYARNFLLPRKLAVEASAGNLKQLEEKMKQQKKKEEAMLAEINNVVAKLNESPIKIGAKTGTSGKIFGSVTNLQISRAIRDQKGYEIERKKLACRGSERIGHLQGTYRLWNGKATDVEFEVIAE
jgi:large subunit ribosomal protein L9